MTINSIQISFLFIFLVILIYNSKDKIQRYIQIILCFFILIDFSVAPGALGISLFDMLTFFILPIFLKYYKKSIFISKNIKIVFYIFLISLIIGSYLSINPLISFIRIFQNFNYLIFFFIFTSYINNRSNFLKIKPYLIYSFLFCFIFLIIQFIIGLNFTFYSQLNPNTYNSGLRFPGPFQDPQKFAQFLSMSGCLFFALSLNAKKIKLQYFTYGILMTFGIFLSASRGAFLGLIIGLIYFTIKQTIQTKKIIYIFLILIFSSFSFFLIENSFLVQRTKNSGEDLFFRQSIWLKAYGYFLENPIFGIGTGSYTEFVIKRDNDQFWVINDSVIYYNHPESGFLLWLVEFGFLGSFILISVILYLINPFFKSGSNSNRLITLLESGIISWIIGFVSVDSLSDNRIGVILLILFSFLYISKFNRSSNNLKFFNYK